MKLGFYVLGAINLASIATATGFTGNVVKIPEDIEEIHKSHQGKVINSDNYQGRINVELVPLGGGMDEFGGIGSLVDEDYQFIYENLNNGEYELFVNSYDFIFANEKYRIRVEDGVVKALPDGFYAENFNETDFSVVSHEIPLQIAFLGPRQFYDKSSNAIVDMVMDSPFGYIFKNSLYTAIFIISMGIIVAPYILSQFFPGFAEELKDAQAEYAGKKSEVPEDPSPIHEAALAAAKTTKTSGSQRVESSNTRKRRN